MAEASLLATFDHLLSKRPICVPVPAGLTDGSLIYTKPELEVWGEPCGTSKGLRSLSSKLFEYLWEDRGSYIEAHAATRSYAR